MNTLYLTAGHSLPKGGASGNGYKEEKLTIEMQGYILGAVHSLDPDINVWTDNHTDSLSTVISKIKKVATGKDVLFDIHFNAASSIKTRGTETFIAKNARGKSRRIAERIAQLTAGMLQTPNRGAKLETASQHPRLAILHTAASSVLWEIEFLSHFEAMENYQELKERLAMGIANILIQELNK